MKNLIDRYLYDVSRRLPEEMRADVERELRSNIEDMLPENPGQGDIEKVLTELGSPAKLAVRYNPRPRYLISPEFFDEYLMVLKIAGICLGALLAALAVFKIVFSDAGSTDIVSAVVSVIAGFIGGAFDGVVYAFFWVTIVFFCIEHFGGKKNARPWSPKYLPEVPANAKGLIRRGDAVARAIFSILFTALFLAGTLRQPPFIAWYETGAPTVALFDSQLVQRFLPFFVSMMALTLAVAMLKLVIGRWNIAVAAMHCLCGIIGAVIGVTFINNPGVFTGAFIARFAEKVQVTERAMSGYVGIAVTVLTVLIVVGAIGDIIATIDRTAKNYK
ncbi:hypothetical protein SAMN02745823_01425 [Sporobacter termitidis DSM 10068]|uniref:Uncharacterized protein n=1 Tax=Sporobacter termitidis DSM 10068 TaxID=1123282 RepID=A0A1M5WW48_9FIRM|nr:hypothetical protein [Sporobacter termitidis]SHH91807.1 hypothetical protein SAMN02745823_01425 [Sporobacter termitidis DSM 10068]